MPDSARGGIWGFGAAMLGALWGYNGWAIITSLGGEVKDPSRTLPRTMVGGKRRGAALRWPDGGVADVRRSSFWSRSSSWSTRLPRRLARRWPGSCR